MYLGDYAEDYATLNFAFTTRATTGVPTVLAGSPVVSVYKGSATATEKTSAETYITLAVDFDSVVGLNNVLIDLSGDAFFAVGEDYKVVLTTGTVGGVSVVGEVLATFSIENRWDNDLATAAALATAQTDITTIIGNTSGLANVSSSVQKVADAYALTTGVQTGVVGNVAALDGITHDHASATNALDLYYETNIGGGTPSGFEFFGYLTSANDSLAVQGYDWVNSAWVQIGTLAGTGGTSIVSHTYGLTVSMVGSGANLGKVRVRFYAASGLTSANLVVDYALFSFNQGANNYDLASVWYDDGAVSSGSVAGIDGTSGNPTSAEASVRLLMTSTGLHRVQVAPGATYTLAATLNQNLMFGHGATLALGGQDVDYSHFFYFAVSGTGTAANGMEFHDCEIGTASVQKAHFYGCTFDGTVTLTLAGDYHIINCQSGVAGSGAPTFAKTAGQAIDAEWRRWSGGITLSGLEVGDTLTISGELGTVDFGSPAGAVAVEIRGTYKGLSNIGSASVNLDGAVLAADVAAILVDTGTTIPALIGTPAADLAADVAAVKVDTAATLVDTADMQPKLGTPAADLAADVAAVKAETALIVADTNELQAEWADGGRLDLILDIIAADTTTDIPALIAALNDLSAAAVNAEVVDVLKTDTVAELAQGIPTATPTIESAIMRIYMALRNEVTVTATSKGFTNDAGTVIWKKALSDDATTYTEAEGVSGP